MAIRRKTTQYVEEARRDLSEKQKFFRQAVKMAALEYMFPENPLDEGRDLDNNTKKYLHLFAQLVLDNEIPNEYERLEQCIVCKYKRVAEVNEMYLIQKHGAREIAGVHPPLDEQAVRKHLQICLPRISGVVSGQIATPSEMKQARGLLDMLQDLDDDAKMLQDAAKSEGEFDAANKSLKARYDSLRFRGELTGELAPKGLEKKEIAGPTMNYVALHPVTHVIQSPHPQIQAAEVIDIKAEE